VELLSCFPPLENDRRCSSLLAVDQAVTLPMAPLEHSLARRQVVALDT